MTFKVGDSAEITKTIEQGDVDAFAEVTGDHNPVHVDEEFAKTTRFGRRIAHGMLTASLISSVLANKLPGEGSVYLGQTLKFVAPVFPGDEITARVTVKEIREEKPIVKLETVCLNQRDEIVIRGEATVLLPQKAQKAQND
jgi:acyl dehydratase